MQKTTVYLDEQSYRELKHIAKLRKKQPAELVRQAVTEFAQRHAPRKRPRTIGAFRSGEPDLAHRFDELLDGFGED